MTEWVKVAKVEEIPSGGRIWYEFEEDTVIVLNVGGRFYCIADLCSHDGESLEDGELDGHTIECPRHGACFDVRTGDALSLPATAPIPTFDIKVEDGFVFVASPDVW